MKNTLKYYRKLSGFTQKEVATILGFKEEARISRWERGISTPSISNGLKLCILYKVPLQKLYAPQLPDLEKFIDEKVTVVRSKYAQT